MSILLLVNLCAFLCIAYVASVYGETTTPFFSATLVSVAAGSPSVCMDQDSASPQTTFFRYPRDITIPTNGTAFIATSSQSGGYALRSLLPNGSTFTTNGKMFTSSSELILSMVVEPLSQHVYVSSNSKIVYRLYGAIGASGSLTEAVCGSVGGLEVSNGSCSTIVFSGPVYLATLSQVDQQKLGGKERYLFVADGSTVRLIDLFNNFVSTLCGVSLGSGSVDGPCREEGSTFLRSVGALAVTVRTNTTDKAASVVIIYIVQHGDGYLRRMSSYVLSNATVATGRESWSIVTIGPSRITTTSMDTTMSMTILRGSIFYSSSEGTAFAWTRGIGIQQIGRSSDGFECTYGVSSSSNFKAPAVVQLSPLAGSVLLLDSSCCTVTSISGQWSNGSSELWVTTAVPFPTVASTSAFSTYSSIDASCRTDSGDVWVFVTDRRFVVIYSIRKYFGATKKVIDTNKTDIRNCVVLQNATKATAYLLHGSTYMISAVDLNAGTFLGVFCGDQQFGVTSGSCDKGAKFSFLRAAYVDSSLSGERSVPNANGFFVGDGSSLRFVLVSVGDVALTPNVTTIGTVSGGDNILGIAVGPSHIYVATSGTIWCSCLQRSEARSVLQGLSTSKVMTQTSGRFQNYFNPNTATVGFLYNGGFLYLSTNQHADMPKVLVRVAVEGASVDMGSLRVVAGAAVDTSVLASSNRTAGISPMLMSLASVLQLQLTTVDTNDMNETTVAIVVPDVEHGIVWQMSSTTSTSAPSPLECTVAGNCSSHAVNATLVGTECKCTCYNQWTGDRCDVCAGRYNASGDAPLSCGACAEGYAGYPHCLRCSNATNCSGRAVAEVTADATGCLCNPCRNQWEGISCGECPQRYDATLDCGACSGGLVDYPACTHPASRSVSPTTVSGSVTPSQSTTGTASLSTSTSNSASRTLTSESSSLSPTQNSHPVTRSSTMRFSQSLAPWSRSWTQSSTLSVRKSASDTGLASRSIATSVSPASLALSPTFWTTSRSGSSVSVTPNPSSSRSHIHTLSCTRGLPSISHMSMTASFPSRTRTYVPPPPPTVAPKVYQCTGPVVVVLSFDASNTVVLQLTRALTVAYILTMQISSCHTFGLPLSVQATTARGQFSAAASVVQQSTSLAGKKLTVVVGPLNGAVDANDDLVVSLLPPIENASALFVPAATVGIEYASNVPNSNNGSLSFRRASAMPNTTLRFAAAATSLGESTVTAMQAGVASVTVVTVIVSSPALAGSAQRQALLTNVAQCPTPLDGSENTLSVATHPLQFPLGGTQARYYAGAMMGGVVVIAAVVMLHAFATVLLGLYFKERFSLAVWRSRFPFLTLPFVSIASQSTMNGALVSLYYADEAGPTTGAAIIIAIVVLGLLWTAHHVLSAQQRHCHFATKPLVRRMERAALAELQQRKEMDRRIAFAVGKGVSAALRLQRADGQTVNEAGLAKVRRRRSYSSVERRGISATVRSFIASKTRARGFWTSVSHPDVLHTHGSVYEELEPEGVYFLVVEVLQNIVSVAIMSFIPTTSEGCRNQFIAVLIVLTAYAVLCLVIQPYLSVVANGIAGCIAILQSLAAWALFVAFQLDDEVWMSVYTALNFMTMGMQMVAGLHGLIKAAYELKSGRDALSRGITLWTALDKRGISFLPKFFKDGALARWPRLDQVISYKLHSISDVAAPLLSTRVAPSPSFSKDEADDILLQNALESSGSELEMNDFESEEGSHEPSMLREGGRAFLSAVPAPSVEEHGDATDILLEFLEDAHRNRANRDALL